MSRRPISFLATVGVVLGLLFIPQVTDAKPPACRGHVCTPPTTTIASTTTTVPSTSTSTTTTTTVPGPTTTTVPAAGTLYSNNFDTLAEMSRLNFEIQPGRTDSTLGGMNFMGDHDMNCGHPFTYRTVNEDGGIANLAWWCNGHFMTGMETGGYREIAFTPSANGQVIIFPATANKVCWDQQQSALGGRKWTEVAVISQVRYNANNGALVYQNPVFNPNKPAGAITMAADDFMMFGVGFQFFRGQENTFQYFSNDGYGGSLTDKATRYQNCLRDNGNGTVTQSQVRPAGVPGAPLVSVTGAGSFPAGPRVFIIVDTTYDADKEQTPGSRIEQPYTNHWDAIQVSAS